MRSQRERERENMVREFERPGTFKNPFADVVEVTAKVGLWMQRGRLVRWFATPAKVRKREEL